MNRSALLPEVRYRGLRFERTLDAAFRTPRYADPIERHIPPSFWTRVALFFKRRFQ